MCIYACVWACTHVVLIMLQRTVYISDTLVISGDFICEIAKFYRGTIFQLKYKWWYDMLCKSHEAWIWGRGLSKTGKMRLKACVLILLLVISCTVVFCLLAFAYDKVSHSSLMQLIWQTKSQNNLYNEQFNEASSSRSISADMHVRPWNIIRWEITSILSTTVSHRELTGIYMGIWNFQDHPQWNSSYYLLIFPQIF